MTILEISVKNLKGKDLFEKVIAVISEKIDEIKIFGFKDEKEMYNFEKKIVKVLKNKKYVFGGYENPGVTLPNLERTANEEKLDYTIKLLSWGLY